MAPGAGIDPRALDAAGAVHRALGVGLGGNLVAAYVHGSAVLGGFLPEVSDLDVLVLCAQPLDDTDVARLRDALAEVHGHLPTKGLELSLLTAAEAGAPLRQRPRYQLHVAIDGNGLVRCVDGRTGDGDRDLVLHVAVCRASGWALEGPAPSTVLVRVPADAALAAMLDEIGWASGAGAAPEYLVLTAARAVVFAATGRLVSKVDAATWVLDSDEAAPEVVRTAREHQQGRYAPVDAGAAQAFALGVRTRLSGASASG